MGIIIKTRRIYANLVMLYARSAQLLKIRHVVSVKHQQALHQFQAQHVAAQMDTIIKTQQTYANLVMLYVRSAQLLEIILVLCVKH